VLAVPNTGNYQFFHACCTLLSDGSNFAIAEIFQLHAVQDWMALGLTPTPILPDEIFTFPIPTADAQVIANHTHPNPVTSCADLSTGDGALACVGDPCMLRPDEAISAW